MSAHHVVEHTTCCGSRFVPANRECAAQVWSANASGIVASQLRVPVDGPAASDRLVVRFPEVQLTRLEQLGALACCYSRTFVCDTTTTQMSPVDPTHVGIAFYNTPAGPRVAWSEPVAGDNATLSAIRCAFVNGTDRKTLLEGVEVGACGELTVQL